MRFLNLGLCQMMEDSVSIASACAGKIKRASATIILEAQTAEAINLLNLWHGREAELDHFLAIAVARYRCAVKVSVVNTAAVFEREAVAVAPIHGMQAGRAIVERTSSTGWRLAPMRVKRSRILTPE